MKSADSLPQDPYMLLSTLNMKLRNQFKDIYMLCNYYNLDIVALYKQLKSIGYEYDPHLNQFK